TPRWTLLPQPAVVRPGAVDPRKRTGAAEVRLLSLRRRPARVYRQSICADGGSDSPGVSSAALPDHDGARQHGRAHAQHHAAPGTWRERSATASMNPFSVTESRTASTRLGGS